MARWVRTIEDFLSLGETFATIKALYGGIPEGGVFYDLGSVISSQGTGKGVIAGSLLHNFEECKGIEILQGLYGISTRLQESYQTYASKLLKQKIFKSLPSVSFIQGSMFDVGLIQVDWSDASMIFANSTCFSSEMMRRLSTSNVAPGTIALTLTTNLDTTFWETLASFRKEMSWGEATVYIQKRRASILVID